MGRELQHSAEGTHWTKKNHKYIRKEGNRYIYADDLKTGRASREQIGARQYKMEQGIRERSQAERRQNASNGLGARNQEFAKAQSGLQRTKQLYKSTGGKVPMEYKVGQMTLRRAQTPTPNTAVEKAKAITQQRNRSANGNSARNQEYAKAQTARQVMNRQGSGVSQPYAKAQAGTTSIRARRKNAMYDQGIGNYADPFEKNKHVTVDQGKNSSDWNKFVMDHEADRHYMNRYYNRQDVLRASKKQKSQGYFTLKNGETEFVPSDKIVMRRLNAGEKFVDNLKSKFGEISAKKDQLAKKAKDFFHKLGAGLDEKRYLSKLYDENSGRPKSYTTHDSRGNYVKGQDPNSLLGPTTGNAGVVNQRKGVEAGRKRAGVKASGNVQGLENNLRNKGYNSSTANEFENRNDRYKGTQLLNKKGVTNLGPTNARRYKDFEASDNEFYNSRYSQNIANGGAEGSIKRGTKAGQKRVNRKKAANGNGAKNQQYAKANPGIEALKYGKAPTPYTDKNETSVDVDKYKNMKFTDKELSKIRKIDSDLSKLHERRDQEAIDKYYDNLSDRDTALYFSYNRRNIANSPPVTGVSLSGSGSNKKKSKK